MNNDIAQANGLQTVKEKIIEECKELIVAIETNDELDILEEIADVRNVTDQWLHIKHKSFECEQMQEFKNDRTRARLQIEINKNIDNRFEKGDMEI